MKNICFFIFLFVLSVSCQNSKSNDTTKQEAPIGIICNQQGCEGIYNGPEFINGEDVAHQFSNQMARKVGDNLKKLYQEHIYSKVDLQNIMMKTDDMDNRGTVIYQLSIPFITVSDSCLATTAFDHRGGWGHQITESSVLERFRLKKGLEFIELKTVEGLQEFWLQWQHNNWQPNCP